MFLLNHKQQKIAIEQSQCFINQLTVCIMGGSPMKKIRMH